MSEKALAFLRWQSCLEPWGPSVSCDPLCSSVMGAFAGWGWGALVGLWASKQWSGMDEAQQAF